MVGNPLRCPGGGTHQPRDPGRAVASTQVCTLRFSVYLQPVPSWDVAVVLFCLGGALISGMGVMLGFRQNRPGPRPNYGSAERCMTLLAGVLQ
jgi:hypothetical protein